MASLDAGCQQALQNDGLYNNMVYNAANATFYQAFGIQGTFTLSEIGYWPSDETLAAWCTEAIACTAGSAGILVTQSFYNQSTAGQYVTLVHELLHYTLAAANGNSNVDSYSDAGTAAFLGISVDPGTSASQAITNWLNAGCPLQPPQ